MNSDELNLKSLTDLKKIGRDKKVSGCSKMKKSELVEALSKLDVTLETVEAQYPIKKDVERPMKKSRRQLDLESQTDTQSTDMLDNYIKSLTKHQLLTHAEKLNVLNVSKLSKRDLLEQIIEQTIAMKLSDLANTDN